MSAFIKNIVRIVVFTGALLAPACAALHAQNLIGKHFDDAVLQLGPENSKVVDGPVTKLRYSDQVIDHPGFGVFREYNQYDFLKGICEARHTYMPKVHEQDFINFFNKKFGKGDHLWRGENDTYIAIKEHGDLFELMVWTPAYEEMLDSLY